MAELAVRVTFDFNTLGFSASVAVPISIQGLLRELPGGAAALLDWMPDITLDALGLSFDPQRQAFGMFLDAGIAGSANPAASALLGTLPGTLPDRDTHAFEWVVGLGLSTPIDLGAVPVLGTLLSGITLHGISIAYATAALRAGAVYLPPPAPPQPAYAAGLTLAMTISAGDASRSFSFAPSGSSRRARGALVRAGAPPPPAAPIQWFEVGAHFGPLAIRRIGLGTTDDFLGLGLDAQLSLTSLAVDLVGFTAGFPKDDLSLRGLRLSLDGLSVFFQSGSLLILGSLVRSVDQGITEYNGAMIIQAGTWGVAAIASFAEVDGAISMFVFGAFQGVLGGPPAFLVTGLAAGFGYNRALKLPTPEQVAQFPLVLIATLGSQYLPDPRDVSASLSKLSAGGWIPPEIGQYWVAAGIQFSTFEVLSTFALLTVQFGNDLVIALLGTSTLQLPKGVDGRPYVFAQMTLDAVLRPSQGTFQMTALLTPASFVIDPNCHLVGGFAFFLWFGGNEHAGDFCVTLGGYNANFTPPPWYPRVPRLGFDWQISGDLHASGGAYFALTPSAVMAGGALSVRYQSGELKAWFDAHADFIMWWKPFYFIVSIGIDVGASYRLNLGITSKTFSVSLSADLALWGPSIAGKAHVKWHIISFTIDINGGGRPSPPGNVLADWTAFAKTYLPGGGASRSERSGRRLGATGDDNSDVLAPRVATGLLQTLPSGPDTILLVAADGISLATQTVIPATTVVIAGPTKDRTRTFRGPDVGVYPLGSMTLASTHTFTVRHRDGGGAVDLGGWTWAPATGSVPESMWGRVNHGRPPLAANTLPSLSGSLGVPGPPVLTGPPEVPLEALAFDELPALPLPLPRTPPIDGGAARPTVDAREVIRQTISAPQVIAARTALVGVMNAAGIGGGTALVPGTLAVTGEEVWYTFQAAPMLGPLGSTGPKPPALAAAPEPPLQTEPQPRPAPPRTPSPLRSMTRPPAPPMRGAAPSLRAIFHRHAAPAPACAASSDDRTYRWQRPTACRARATVLDGFAARADRAHAGALLRGEGGRVRTAIAPGATLVWDVPEASRLTIDGDGALPLRVTILDRHDDLIEDAWLEAGAASIALPDRASRLAITCAAALPDGVAGWHGATQLLVAGPQALLADGAVVRPQSPFRPPRGRTSRDAGVTTGRALARANGALGERGREVGWIETALPPWTRTIIAIVRRGAGAASDAAAATVVAIERPGAAPARSRPCLVTYHRELAYLVHEVPGGAELGAPRATIWTHDGWLADGVLGFAAAPAAVLGDVPGPALAPAVAPRAARAASTEIAFR